MTKIMIEISDDDYESIKKGMRYKDTIANIVQQIEDAEPILSSSEKPSRWIPCSERLPETTDYYLVTVGINEYGLMIPSVRTALYNAKTKDFTVHTGTNMSIVEDVVAWCDCLPKPYQSEIPTGEEGSEE